LLKTHIFQFIDHLERKTTDLYQFLHRGLGFLEELQTIFINTPKLLEVNVLPPANCKAEESLSPQLVTETTTFGVEKFPYE
jgi:hypothetical protein